MLFWRRATRADVWIDIYSERVAVAPFATAALSYRRPRLNPAAGMHSAEAPSGGQSSGPAGEEHNSDVTPGRANITALRYVAANHYAGEMQS